MAECFVAKAAYVSGETSDRWGTFNKRSEPKVSLLDAPCVPRLGTSA